MFSLLVSCLIKVSNHVIGATNNAWNKLQVIKIKVLCIALDFSLESARDEQMHRQLEVLVDFIAKIMFRFLNYLQAARSLGKTNAKTTNSEENRPSSTKTKTTTGLIQKKKPPT